MSDIAAKLRQWADADVDETARDGTLEANDIRKWGEMMREAADEIERLRTEIEVLRHYGNKGCTAMADDALEQKRLTGKFPFED